MKEFLLKTSAPEIEEALKNPNADDITVSIPLLGGGFFIAKDSTRL